jgi:hypothetical protein
MKSATQSSDVLSTRQFTYDPETRRFVSEMSDLGLTQVPDKVKLKSTRTGFVKVFPYSSTRFSNGEVVAWVYRADGIEVHLLND